MPDRSLTCSRAGVPPCPPNPAWFHRLDEILSALRSIESTRLDRLAVEKLFRGQTPVPQGANGSVASTAPRHQQRPGTPLRLGDFRSEKGRNPATPLPPPAYPILEQHLGAGSSSDQTASEGQAGLSCIPRGKANDPGIRGNTHDPEGAGAAGERFRCSATDSVHQQAVRGGCMRRRSVDPIHGSPVVF